MPTDYSPWSKQVTIHIPNSNNFLSSSSKSSSSSLTGGGAGNSSSSNNISAYFTVKDGDNHLDNPFLVIKLTDPIKIQKARNQINGIEPKLHIIGNILKGKACYNPDYNFYYDSNTIDFFEMAMEVCDANFKYVEEHLDEIGGAFLPGNILCSWSSYLVSEILPLCEAFPSANFSSSYSTRTVNSLGCTNSIDNISNVICEPSSSLITVPPTTCRNSVQDFDIKLTPVFSLATCGMKSPLGGGDLPGQILFRVIGKFTSNVNKDLECGNGPWNENLFQNQPYWNNWKTPKDLIKELPYSNFLNTEGLPINKKIIYDWIRYPYESGADVAHEGGDLGAIGQLYKIAGCKQILNKEKTFYPGSVCQGQLNCNSSQINNSSSSSSNSSDNFCGLDLGAEIDFVSTNPWAIFYPKIEIFSEDNTDPIYIHEFKFVKNLTTNFLISGSWYTTDAETLTMTGPTKDPQYERLAITSAIAPICFCRPEGNSNVGNYEINNHHIRIWGNEWKDPMDPKPFIPLLSGPSCGTFKNLTAKITLQVPKIRIKIRDKINLSNGSLCRGLNYTNEPKIEVKAIDLIDLGLSYSLPIPTPTPRPDDYCCSSSSSRKLCNGFVLDCQPGFIKVCPSPKPCPNSDEGCTCQPQPPAGSSNTSNFNAYEQNSLALSKDGAFIVN